MIRNMLQMPGVWFSSGWNYTLRAEPESSLDPAEARIAWGSQPRAMKLSREAARAGGRFPAGNQVPGSVAIPDTCGGLFIHSVR